MAAGLAAIGAAGTASAQAPAAQPLSVDLLSLASSPLTLSTAGSGRSVGEGTSVRIRGFGLYSEAAGEMDFDSDFAVVDAVNNIDLEDTLGMDLSKLSGGALVGFNFGGKKQFHLDFIYQGYYDFEGTRDVGTMVFDGQLFTGEVDSSAQLLEVDVDFRWDFWKPEAPDLT